MKDSKSVGPQFISAINHLNNTAGAVGQGTLIIIDVLNNDHPSNSIMIKDCLSVKRPDSHFRVGYLKLNYKNYLTL